MKRFLLAAFIAALPLAAQAETITIEVAGPGCPGCIGTIINIFLGNPAVVSANADIPHSKVILTTKSDLDDRAIGRTLGSHGYQAKSVERAK